MNRFKQNKPSHKTNKRTLRYFQILEVAENVFLNYGYNETNIQKISQEAQVGYGTVYNYFGTKEDVLIQIVNSIIDQLKDVIYIIYSPKNKKEVYDIVLKQISDALKIAEDYRGILRVFLEGMGQSQKISDYWSKLINKYIQRAEDDITYSQEHLLAKLYSKRIIGKSFVYLVINFFWDIVLERETDPTEVAINLTDFYISGVYK